LDVVGSYEAKTHLPALLERVSKGEQITITRHGVPVAMLVPMPGHRREDAQRAIDALREFRTGQTLGEVSVRELIEEGRR
jgi:prevent-host-death family protein